MPQRYKTLAHASFDPRLKVYMVFYTMWILLVSVVGIIVLPFWLFLGPLWARRYFERLECILTERSLIVKKGVLFRTEKTIPLDKIQDFSLKEGPLLRKLGLSMLNIETAGQSGQGSAEASLVGVQDVFAFRDRVLDQRDLLTGTSPGSQREVVADGADPDVLGEIRDSLLRIERHLRSQGPSS